MTDINVIYFNASKTDKGFDIQYEEELFRADPALPWSVKNQTRMHERNGDLPYHSNLHALAHFPETASAIGIRLNKNGQLVLLAPYGVHDLLHLLVRPTLYYANHWDEKISVYKARLAESKWKATWNQLSIDHDR